MRYFFDTEFIEDGKTIDLISIGIVCEDGREYYAINKDCDLSKASDWVKANVISRLPPKNVNLSDPSISPRIKEESLRWKSKEDIADDVGRFFGCISNTEVVVDSSLFSVFLRAVQCWREYFFPPDRPTNKHGIKLVDHWECIDEEPEIWADYCSYDWVCLCQLFGTMMDLPKNFPMYCRDLKQWRDQLGNPDIPEQTEGQHNALEDARWNKLVFDHLSAIATTPKP